MSAKRSELFA